MNTELSSGAVIIRKREHTYEMLLIRDKQGMLTFPKGYIEQHESVIQAARREAKEETGIMQLRFKATLPPISYVYTRNHMVIHKTVYYALFSYTGNHVLQPQVEEGISDIQWMPIEKARSVVGYPKTNKGIIETVMTLL